MYDQTLLHQLRDDFDGNIKNVWDSYTIDRKAFQWLKFSLYTSWLLYYSLEKRAFESALGDLNGRIHREEKKRNRKKRDPKKGTNIIDFLVASDSSIQWRA